jgi:hypothetical protein
LSNAGLRRPAAAIALAALLPFAACGKGQEPVLTYYSGEHAVSVRYPASWGSQERSDDNIWSRYFALPGKASVSATLLVAAHAGSLDEFAQSYLSGHGTPSVQDTSRQGVPGRVWRYASADGQQRFALLLLKQGGRVYGVYEQAPAADFERHQRALQAIEESLTLERPDTWTERRLEGLALRLPASWTPGQSFSSGGATFTQFLSPALGIEKGQAVHASLTATVEPAPSGSLDGYYQAGRARQGDAYKVFTHLPWRGGYVDMMRTETPISVARVKRYVWTRGTRGYTLSCDGREDVFPRVTRWCDAIASTLQIEGQPLPPAEAAPLPTPSPSAGAIMSR